MNVLNVFRHPRATVRESLANPNFPLAIGLVIAFVVLGFLNYPLNGVAFPVMEFVMSLVKTIIGLVIVTGVIYFIAFLLKDREMKVTATGIASAFSLTYAYFIAAGIITTVFTLLLVSPGAMVVGDIASNEALTMPETTELMEIIQDQDAEALQVFASQKELTAEETSRLTGLISRGEQLFNPQNIMLLSIIMLLSGLISLIGMFLVMAFIVAEVFNKGLLKNAIIFIVLLIIFGFVGNNIFTLF